MILHPDHERLFWWTARERQNILLRRQAGLPRDQWTQDPVFRSHHFCNVFRSDDRVSQMIIRLTKRLGRFNAALTGRLINRYETLDMILKGETIREAMAACGINTNAYRLNTPLGLNKAEGLHVMMNEAQLRRDRVLTALSIPAALAVLGEVSCLGGFVGYQIILDLIELGAFSSDFVDDWCWAGPGAGRGAMRLLGQKPSGSWMDRSVWGRPEDKHPELVQAVMSHLLTQAPANWPTAWRPWTIHEVEGWLCEYDKWARRTFNESPGGRRFKGRYGVDYQPAARAEAK